MRNAKRTWMTSARRRIHGRHCRPPRATPPPRRWSWRCQPSRPPPRRRRAFHFQRQVRTPPLRGQRRPQRIRSQTPFSGTSHNASEARRRSPALKVTECEARIRGGRAAAQGVRCDQPFRGTEDMEGATAPFHASRKRPTATGSTTSRPTASTAKGYHASRKRPTATGPSGHPVRSWALLVLLRGDARVRLDGLIALRNPLPVRSWGLTCSVAG